MGKNDKLPGLTDKIAARLATKPEVLIIHPAELRVVRSMTDQELRAFAEKNGWRVVRRLGGRQIEFYNDAGTGVYGVAEPQDLMKCRVRINGTYPVIIDLGVEGRVNRPAIGRNIVHGYRKSVESAGVVYVDGS